MLGPDSETLQQVYLLQGGIRKTGRCRRHPDPCQAGTDPIKLFFP
jgi:hypothetical protein